MARRNAGDGNIYKRSDGRWEARMQVGYRGARRIRKSFYGVTRREVQAKLLSARHELASGILPKDGRLTVDRFLDTWLTEVVTPSVRPSTRRSYEMHVRLHISPAIGRCPLVRLTPADVQRLLAHELATGSSPRSVNHVRAVLRSALTCALRWGLVNRNVAALVEPARVSSDPPRPISPDAAREFLAAVRGDRLEALFVVALATGLRQGEALGLRWADIDLPTRTLAVRAALQRVEGELVLVEPKSRASRRSISIPNIAVSALRAHRTRQVQERLSAASHWSDSGLVFTTATGGPLDGASVTHHLHLALRRAGLPQMRFHDLRHGCASLLLAQGVHPRVVMEVLGHSQISLTLNTYSHVIPQLLTEAADQLDSALA